MRFVVQHSGENQNWKNKKKLIYMQYITLKMKKKETPPPPPPPHKTTLRYVMDTSSKRYLLKPTLVFCCNSGLENLKELPMLGSTSHHVTKLLVVDFTIL